MILIKERVFIKAIDNESDSGKILNFLAEEKHVALEMIIERFPWVRWDDMFLILSGLRRKGLVIVHQVDTILEVRIREKYLNLDKCI